MSGCCDTPKPCHKSPVVDIWTRPLNMGREEFNSCCNSCASGGCCEKEASDCDTINTTGCNFSWSITPIQTTPGGTVTFNGINLPPNANFQVKVVGTNTEYYWSIQSDSAGGAIATMQMPIAAGPYQFTPIVNNCRALPLRNSVTVIAAIDVGTSPCDCLGTVVIQPVFVETILYSGTQTNLLFTVTNTNSCPATEINLPPITLPNGLVSGPISLNNVTVAGNSIQTFTFAITANNSTASDIQAGVVIPAQFATYKCNGVTHYAGGGSAYATIKSTVTGSCNLIIESFTVSPIAISNNGTATYTLKVKNTGTNPINNLQFGPINLASGIVATTPPVSLAASGVSLAAGATHTVTATAAFKATPLTVGQQHAHQILIPAGAITADCNFGQISNMLPSATSLIINGV